MNKIFFPRKEYQRYYKYHYTFFLKLFEYAGLNIEFCPSTEIDAVRFTVNIDGKEVLIDFSDHLQLLPEVEKYGYCFKSHYDYYTCHCYGNIFPFTPITFHNWDNYYNFKDKIKYKCNNNLILNNQKAYCGAKVRRLFVQDLLKKKYGNDVDFSITDKETFYKKINNCLVAICVPGARNDIIDGGQLQRMAFGCCTISPILRAVGSYYKQLSPWVHYIPVKQDYLDLIEKIEWCKDNKGKCIEIGNNAKEFFAETYIPHKIVEWMDKILK